MKTVKEEVENLYNWVVEELDNVEIDKCGNDYDISIGDGSKYLSFTVTKTDDWPIFIRYNISYIRGMQTHGRYESYSKLIKKIYDIAEKEYAKRELVKDDSIYREYIQDIIDYDPDDEDFDFGSPMHHEKLPQFPLVVGETYLVPLKLIRKERRFDGGRGTEYYEFNYQTDNYGYKSFRIPDYHMTPQIERVYDCDTLVESLTESKPINEELERNVRDIANRSTFC